MIIDVIFFKNIINMLETNHNIVRNNDMVTETWKHYVDATIGQCKEMIAVAKYQEEREAIFTEYDEIITRLENLGDARIFKQISQMSDEE